MEKSWVLVIITSMMPKTHEKIMKLVIIPSMMTKSHEKNHNNGHHNTDDEQNPLKK
jgi:hypothetical protein